MICSQHMAFSLVTLYAIVVFYTLTKSQLHHGNMKRKPPLPRHIKKKPSYQCSAANKDIISQLPDDILILIIARLPVKCGIRTTILSKRWMNLYRYVSNIKLHCGDLLERNYDVKLHDSNLVMDSVNRFLRLRSGSVIRSFHLSCSFFDLTADRFKQCTLSLGKLGVEKLVISCACHCYFDTCVYAFRFDLLSEIPSLKYLKLGTCYFLEPSWKSQCNSLQHLFLFGVKLCSGDLENILSNCLSLHSLRFVGCYCPSKLNFRGRDLQLMCLYMNSCVDLKEIEFYASNLVSVKFSNPKLVTFTFDHVPQLDSIYISTSEENIVPYVSKISKELPHLKSLSFDTGARVYFQENIRSIGINTFSNLRRLGLTLTGTEHFDLFLLIAVLRSCPLLQEFHLNTCFVTPNEPQENNKQSIVFHPYLKKVNISGFHATENEIEFASYILKSSTSFEKMYISKCFKTCWRFAKWDSFEVKRDDEPRWSKEMVRMIHRRLQGQAISKTARVNIQYAAHFEDDVN